MISFTARRRISTAILLAASLLFWVYHSTSSDALMSTQFVSGWLLVVLFVGLASFSLRKKIPMLPLLNASAWLQAHLYMGYFTIVLFAFHIRFQIPNGAFETMLALVYVLVAGTGVFGLILTRWVPARLTGRRQEVIFERIPALIAGLRKESEEIVLNLAERSGATTVPDFYTNRLQNFFGGIRNRFPHLAQSPAPRLELLAESAGLERYVTDEEKDALRELTELIELKDELDYQYAHQGILKAWLFLHIPLTYVLLILSVVHAYLAHAFAGGIG